MYCSGIISHTEIPSTNQLIEHHCYEILIRPLYAENTIHSENTIRTIFAHSACRIVLWQSLSLQHNNGGAVCLPSRKARIQVLRCLLQRQIYASTVCACAKWTLYDERKEKYDVQKVAHPNTQFDAHRRFGFRRRFIQHIFSVRIQIAFFTRLPMSTASLSVKDK